MQCLGGLRLSHFVVFGTAEVIFFMRWLGHRERSYQEFCLALGLPRGFILYLICFSHFRLLIDLLDLEVTRRILLHLMMIRIFLNSQVLLSLGKTIARMMLHLLEVFGVLFASYRWQA